MDEAPADGDLMELIPLEAYSCEDLDWTEEGSRVNKEHDDETMDVSV